MINKLTISLLCIFFIINTGYTQSLDIKTGDKEEDKINIRVGGRLAFDGAVFFDDKTPLGNGMTISDTRISAKMKYKKWDVKIDMGFNNRKVSTKDLHLEYNINPKSYIRIGYYGEQFGFLGSSAWFKFNTIAPSTMVFGTGRQVGVVYAKWSDKLYLLGGLFSDNDAITNSKEGNQGYAAIGKVSSAPVNKDGNLIHIGISGEFRTGNRDGLDENNHTKRILRYSTSLGTHVETKKALDFTLDQVKNQFRFNTEFIMTSGPVFVQGEIYKLYVKRKEQYHSYRAGGFYTQAGILLSGDKKYNFHLRERNLSKPSGDSFELVVRYDYIDLNDGVYENEVLKGGRMSDLSVGLNYYLDKYVGFKLNYSYIALGRENNFGSKEYINLLQGRVVVSF